MANVVRWVATIIAVICTVACYYYGDVLPLFVSESWSNAFTWFYRILCIIDVIIMGWWGIRLISNASSPPPTTPSPTTPSPPSPQYLKVNTTHAKRRHEGSYNNNWTLGDYNNVMAINTLSTAEKRIPQSPRSLKRVLKNYAENSD